MKFIDKGPPYPEDGHGCAPMCAVCRAELQNRMNPTGDPLGFNVDRWLAGEEDAKCGCHSPLAQVIARLRERHGGSLSG